MSEAKNSNTIRYGNKDGEIKFGHIHDDNEISAVMIRSGSDPKHYITLDATGNTQTGRKGGIINRCTGSYQVKCGDNVKSGSTDGSFAFYVECENGDVVFKAPRGRIKFEAENIELLATGADNKNGIITLKSNEKVEILSKNVEVNATSVAKFFSSGTCKVVGNAILDIYGGLAACATGADKLKKSKYGGTAETENNQVGG
jgi:hypothetical protein